jgi:hypothetical protein
VHRHPVSGERTWFNHALFFHVTSLPAEVSEGLRSVFGEEEMRTTPSTATARRSPTTRWPSCAPPTPPRRPASTGSAGTCCWS